jgi:hypothetical protein
MVQHFFFFELTTPSFGLRVDNDNRALSSQPEDGGEDTRACIQLRRIVTAASCTPARKFLASLS